LTVFGGYYRTKYWIKIDEDRLQNSISSVSILHPDDRVHQGALSSGFYFARGTNSSILILVPSEVAVGEKLNQ